LNTVNESADMPVGGRLFYTRHMEWMVTNRAKSHSWHDQCHKWISSEGV